MGTLIREPFRFFSIDDPEYLLIGFTAMAFFVGYLLASRCMRRWVTSEGVFGRNRRARAETRRERASESRGARRASRGERGRARGAPDADEAADREHNAHGACTTDVRRYARVLGLQGKVTPDILRARYRALAAQYHPDKVHHLGPKLQILAARELKAINEAYAYFKKRMGL